MKKISAVLLTLFAFAASTVFADDAQVLPKGVFRITTAVSYGTASKEFDADGKSQDLKNNLSLLNLGLALEYGVNDWISAAFQWAPGYNVWSEFKDTDPTQKINGAMDIFAGAKVQIVGQKAPIANDKVRFAAAAGIKIPLPGADFEEQLKNAMKGEDYILSDPDKHAWGLGTRLYADYVINEMFFINAYSEFIYYLERKDVGVLTQVGYMEMDIAHGYDLTFELEPHFEYMVSEGLRLGSSLPITYTMSPDVKYNGDAKADSASNSLSIGPNVSCFFMKSAVPFELKLAYITPLMGTNVPAKINTISLQGKIYLKF